MKTAISLPDEVFEQAEGLAKRKGMSRSELYVQALRLFLEREEGDQVTRKLNEVYGKVASQADPVLSALQFRALPRDEW